MPNTDEVTVEQCDEALIDNLRQTAKGFDHMIEYGLRELCNDAADRIEALSRTDEGVQVTKVETVSGDFYTEPGEPFWRIEIDGYCADFDHEAAAKNFADAINNRRDGATDEGLVERVAEAICAERCAVFGDPPCSRVCDAPICEECKGMSLAALSAVSGSSRSGG